MEDFRIRVVKNVLAKMNWTIDDYQESSKTLQANGCWFFVFSDKTKIGIVCACMEVTPDVEAIVSVGVLYLNDSWKDSITKLAIHQGYLQSSTEIENTIFMRQDVNVEQELKECFEAIEEQVRSKMAVIQTVINNNR